MPCELCCDLRGAERDAVAETLEKADASTGGALRVAAVEVVGAELLVRGFAGEEGVGEDEDLVTHGNDGLPIAAMAHDAAVACTQGGVPGARGRLCRLDEGHAQPLAPFPRLAGLPLPRTLVVPRAHARPAGELARSREATHVETDFRGEHLGRTPLDARDGRQALNRRRKRAQLRLDPHRAL